MVVVGVVACGRSWLSVVLLFHHHHDDVQHYMADEGSERPNVLLPASAVLLDDALNFSNKFF